jgi:hypothetical protein
MKKYVTCRSGTNANTHCYIPVEILLLYVGTAIANSAIFHITTEIRDITNEHNIE